MIRANDLRMRGELTNPKGSLSVILLFVAAAFLAVPNNLHAAIPSQERTALIDLYTSTNGPNWTINAGWVAATPGTECNWYGVTCNSTNTSVLALNLSNNQLSGSIPSSLGNLTNIEDLELYNNQLTGSIPSSLGTLANLQNLYLSGNQLTGSVPSSLGNLTNLQNLYLTNNQLTGSIPSGLGNLTNLQDLSLDLNQLTGSIPSSLGNLANLAYMYLGGNQLSGSIPTELGNLTILSILDLDGNQLTGSIPAELGSLANLQSLDLGGNQLTGSIPVELGNLIVLESLYLSGNQLSGSIPPELGNLSNLQYLYMSANQLSGSIPPELGNYLTNLLLLDLNGNQLTGSIPAELGNLASLQSLDLGINQLTGSIPAELGNLTNLQELYLYNNQLSGGIEVSLGGLTNLALLALSGNQLSGSIPAELGNLTNLQNLYLGGNQLNGNIPPSLVGMATLTVLDLSYNALYATDPGLLSFLNSKEADWQNTQTVAPKNLSAIAQSTSSILVSWSPIAYIADSGRYEVYQSGTSGGPYILAGSTADKTASSFPLTGLSPSTPYYIVVRTITDPNANNLNTVTSDYSNEVFANTAGVVTSVSITVNTNPTGRSLIVDTITYVAPQTFLWDAGSSHTIAAVTPQESSGTRYVFANWSDGGAASHAITVPAAPTTYIAGFNTQYQLTTSVTPAAAGAVNASPISADGYYASNASVQLTATAYSGYAFSHWGGDLAGTANPQTLAMIAPSHVTATFLPTGSIGSIINSGGAAIESTAGSAVAARVGYAAVSVNLGTAPYGTAVFSLKQNGVILSEAGVPASPPTTSARVFIDYRSSVPAVPAHSEAGTVNINTGIAVVNYGSASATVTYTLRDGDGVQLAVGHGTIDIGSHFACFIDQLQSTAAPDFRFPPDFQSATQFGSLEITSDQPLSVLALRGTNNQRNDFLITTTPIADITQSLGNSSIFFPQFVDGGGYTTSLILLNTSGTTETGSIQIMDANGNPLTVNQVGGTANSSFNYAIPSHGVFHFQTDGFPTDAKAGWVRVTPSGGSNTPVGSGVFGFTPANILVSESGIPSAAATTHARIYVDLSTNHNTGLAIANVTGTDASITINAFQLDGSTVAGTSQGPFPLSPNGYSAAFADQFISGLPGGFTGVLDIYSPTPFAALTLRSLVNERNDFLMTTFPVADATQSAPTPIVFPQIVDGGGYTTQFILISAGPAASTTLSYYDETGAPTDFSK